MQQLLDIIPYGIANSISCSELAKALDTDVRTLQKSIAALRRNGVIICSNMDKTAGKTGYYKPLDKQELSQYVSCELMRINSMIECLNPAKEYLMKGESLKTQ